MLPLFRRYWYVLLLILVIVGGAVGIFLIQRQLGTRSTSLQPTDSQGIQRPVNSKYDITHYTVETPKSDMYVLSGHFIEPLFYQNNILMGNFVVDGDQNNSPIRIQFGPKESNFSLGKTTGDQATWGLVTMPELETGIHENVPVEVRVVLYASQDIELNKKDLEALMQDDKIEPFEYGLFATMVREK